MEEVLAETRAGTQAFTVEAMDELLIVSIEVTKDIFTDTVRNLDDLMQEVKSELLARLGVEAEVRLTEPSRGGDPSR